MEASDLGKRHDKIVILLWLYDCFVLDLCITTAANRSKNLLQLQDGPRLQGNLMKSQHVYGALAPSTCSRQASSPLVTLKFHRWLSHVAWSLGFAGNRGASERSQFPKVARNPQPAEALSAVGARHPHLRPS